MNSKFWIFLIFAIIEIEGSRYEMLLLFVDSIFPIILNLTYSYMCPLTSNWFRQACDNSVMFYLWFIFLIRWQVEECANIGAQTASRWHWCHWGDGRLFNSWNRCFCNQYISPCYWKSWCYNPWRRSRYLEGLPHNSQYNQGQSAIRTLRCDAWILFFYHHFL